MELLLLPLLGPLHLLSPALNAMTLRDAAAAFRPGLLASTALGANSLQDPSWQDTEEIALPLALIPWALGAGVRVAGLATQAPGDGAEEADFRRVAAEVPDLQRRLAPVLAAESELQELLSGRLTPALLLDEVLPLVRRIELGLEQAAGDGPATGRRFARAAAAVQRLTALAGAGRVVLLAGLQELPALERALDHSGVNWQLLPRQPEISEAARNRSLLDQALTSATLDNREALLEALEREGSAEAGYHRSSLLLAAGDAPAALALLERVANTDFSRPYFLPGWLLARLGQLRDLAGEREAALKAYRGVLALSWAPAEALEAARDGLAAPFGSGNP